VLFTPAGTHSVLIDKPTYKGYVDTPKGRKAKRTSRTVDL
jgi:hypothetical protein